ncbi:UMP kinase [Candidatus Beckwithbacteria bacterium RBG_13_42_9]|uniref:Uridylate kinase n=1 Tax=Candidatus Beckwithbacteria bacterium RBG_13_42_9 TaxID=1797457 RepID=A0A1F5E986_9BACT|nr:MAG: UMP kinase [Candidatus Beckwithbacteria bacterium RBG_13_42_9]
MSDDLVYKRVLLKLGGELFGKENGKGISFDAYEKIARDIIKIKERNSIELAIVVGGGNIFRGREAGERHIDETVADQMGMLATVINGLALQEALERLGFPTRMLTAVRMEAMAEPYILRRAIRHLEKGRLLIFTAGIGSPFFTTDSAAALRACEIRCDVILKATNADGVYEEDPKVNPNAKKYERLSYQEALEKHLQVMDNTAFALCQRKKIPIIVFSVADLDKIPEIVRGAKIGTLVSE